jgi:predicted heme/steroid binding protein
MRRNEKTGTMDLNGKNHLWVLLSLILFLFPSPVNSTPDYAEQTGRDCSVCHVEATGGKLTEAGENFKEDLKVKGLYRPLQPLQKIIRLFIGYLHLLTAIAWFGTILYVHILLKPAYAAKGLPRGELILGWMGIVLLSITGVLLTFARIPSWKLLYTTRFGILLSIKIFLFLIMATTAVIVTFVIGPKLRKHKQSILPQNKNRLTIEELSYFDGKESRPAYIAYKEKIYDVSSSKFWNRGSHMTKHSAGNDLTDFLGTAPHGEEKVFQMPVRGELVSLKSPVQKPTHEKVFYFMAYMNLIFVFLITFVIALWRWW